MVTPVALKYKVWLVSFKYYVTESRRCPKVASQSRLRILVKVPSCWMTLAKPDDMPTQSKHLRLRLEINFHLMI